MKWWEPISLTPDMETAPSSPGHSAVSREASTHESTVIGLGGAAVRPNPIDRVRSVLGALRRAPIFWLGLALLVAPTIIELAVRDWGTDQAGHAPIVFATAIWLFVINWRAAAALAAAPDWRWATLAVLPWLILYCAAKVTGLLEIRGLAVYGFLVATLYAVGGPRMLGALWFPVFYCIFLIPLPESFIDFATQPIKLAISATAVNLLAWLDYPVASSGVSIYIGQFELFIAAACAGLNSLISLTAIGSFYIYLRHNAAAWYTALLIALIIPIAIFANFARVVTLVLVTYYLGEAAAQGFLHEFAGLFMFVVAVLVFFATDMVLSRLTLPNQAPSHG